MNNNSTKTQLFVLNASCQLATGATEGVYSFSQGDDKLMSPLPPIHQDASFVSRPATIFLLSHPHTYVDCFSSYLLRKSPVKCKLIFCNRSGPGRLFGRWYSVSQGDDNLMTEQQVKSTTQNWFLMDPAPTDCITGFTVGDSKNGWIFDQYFHQPKGFTTFVWLIPVALVIIISIGFGELYFMGIV